MTTTLSPDEAARDERHRLANETEAARYEALGDQYMADLTRANNTPERRAHDRYWADQTRNRTSRDRGPDYEAIWNARAENARGSWWRDGGAL